MTDDVYERIETKLNDLQSELNNKEIPCERVKDGETCIRRAEQKPPKNGKLAFYYATDCKEAQKLCNTCAAYWHVAVARNALMFHQKSAKSIEAEQARECRAEQHAHPCEQS